MDRHSASYDDFYYIGLDVPMETLAALFAFALFQRRGKMSGKSDT